MWGYTKSQSFDLGVRKEVQVQFGGPRSLRIQIWGYASTKRLSTAGIRNEDKQDKGENENKSDKSGK